MSTSERPLKLDNLKFLCTEGFLKSQSTIITFFSFWAKDKAIFPATVDFPSATSALVTIIVFICLSKDEYCIFVLKVLYASDTIDFGFFQL